MLRDSLAHLCESVPNLWSGPNIGHAFPQKYIEPRLTNSGLPNLFKRKGYKGVWIIVIEVGDVPTGSGRLRGSRCIKDIGLWRSAKDGQGEAMIGQLLVPDQMQTPNWVPNFAHSWPTSCKVRRTIRVTSSMKKSGASLGRQSQVF